MQPLDLRPLPDSVPADVRNQTAVAAGMRAGTGATAVESLLALNESGTQTFDDVAARRYIVNQFGEEALQAYLDRIPRVSGLLPVIDQGAWKSTPLSTGLALGCDVLGGGEQFLYAQHLRIISNKIVAAVRGTGKRRIAVAMPYRHGKSGLCTTATPLWFLSNWGHLQVGLTAHSDSLATKFSRFIRNAIQSNPGKLGFGLAQDSQAVHEFHTQAGGGLWSGSIGSGIQGKGANLLIVDDPFGNVKDAESKINRETVWQWFMGSALTRVQDEGIILFATTRWWSDDLFGRLQSGADDTDPSLWDFLTLPAIAIEDDDAIGRHIGEPLWAEKRPLQELLSFKASQSEAAWARGYQQICLDDQGLNRAYKAWDSGRHVRTCEWDGANIIHVGVDYNVEPMSATILMTNFSWAPGWTNQKIYFAQVLDEISIDNSNTVELSRVLVQRLLKLAVRNQRIEVKVYADSTGNARQTGTEKVGDTNWKILCREIAAAAMGTNLRFEFCKTTTNPSQAQRVDLVNSMLEHDRLIVDPRCKWLSKDFKEVRWRVDRSGNKDCLDKVSDSSLTHASDSCGYALWGAINPGGPWGLQGHSLPGITH